MIVNNNKQSARKLAEGIRGRERVLFEYGKRKGQSLVGKYKREKFVIWHCDNAFKARGKCMDGVCGDCYVQHMDSSHSCGVCGQEIGNYRDEKLQGMLNRKRDNWSGIAPKKCAIVEIVL